MFEFLKLSFCISAILFSLTISHAQLQVGIGVKGGLNISKISLNTSDFAPDASNNVLHAASLGLVINLKFSKLFSLQPELIYSTQGTIINVPSYSYPIGNSQTVTTTASQARYKFNYVQVPVLAKISFGNENVRGFINAGPYLGYLSSVKIISTSLGKVREFKIDFSDQDIKESINRIDFGVSIGLGIAFKIGPGDIFFESRYNFGILDINKGEMTKVSGYKPSTNSVFNISAGYIFFFGGK